MSEELLSVHRCVQRGIRRYRARLEKRRCRRVAAQEKKIAASVAQTNRWLKTLRVCRFCGDVVLCVCGDRRICEDCWDEILGRDNGEKHLRGKTVSGRQPRRSLAENDQRGLPGKMGYRGPGPGQWDNIVRAYYGD